MAQPIIKSITVKDSTAFVEEALDLCTAYKAHYYIRGGIEDNSKMIFLISQQKHML